MRVVRTVAALGVAVGLALAGCSSQPGTFPYVEATYVAPASPAPSTPAVTQPPVPVPVPAAVVVTDRASLAVIDPFAVTPDAVVDDGSSSIKQLAAVGSDLGALVYATPGGVVLGVLPSRTLSSETVVPVVGSANDGAWLLVELPSRLGLPSAGGPVNGAAGWVSDTEVTLTAAGSSLVVDLAAQTATVLDATGAATYSTPVAVGKAATPTPSARGFIASGYDLPGTYTPRVLATSLHSATLDQFDGDVAGIALHTVTGLATSGRVSNGCIRLADDTTFDSLNLPSGTPIIIVGA